MAGKATIQTFDVSLGYFGNVLESKIEVKDVVGDVVGSFRDSTCGFGMKFLDAVSVRDVDCAPSLNAVRSIWRGV